MEAEARAQMSILAIAAVLIVFGILAGFSIGQPFLLLGIGLLILYPCRLRRRVFWPLLIGLVAFLTGMTLVTPMWCTAVSIPGGPSQTVCTNVLGFTWSGAGLYNPPPEARVLAALVGLIAGLVATLAMSAALTVGAVRTPAGKPR
jgi:hypothetical protein